MNRKAVLFLAAVMTAGSTVSAAAAETFADINDVPWGGAQAYINSVFEKGLMVGDIDDSGRRVFRARDNISYNETVQLVYTLSGKTVSDEVINKWAADMRSNNIPRWAYDSVAFALEAGIITRSDLAVFVNADQSARPITRETAAYIFGRFLSEEGVEPTAAVVPFNDGTTIATVADMSNMQFQGNIDETDVGKLHEGMPVKLTIGALQDVELDATLEYVAPKSTESNGVILFEVKAAVQIPQGVFVRAGYSANASVVIQSREGVLTLPEGCVEFEGDKTYVQVLTSPEDAEDQTFERREVRIGLSDGVNVEITEGVTAGDKIRGARIDTKK